MVGAADGELGVHFIGKAQFSRITRTYGLAGKIVIVGKIKVTRRVRAANRANLARESAAGPGVRRNDARSATAGSHHRGHLGRKIHGHSQVHAGPDVIQRTANIQVRADVISDREDHPPDADFGAVDHAGC